MTEVPMRTDGRTTINYSKIPVVYMVAGVRRYIERGTEFGNFLTALFENDLKGAVNGADLANRDALREWVQWLHWEAPMGCHGSAEKMKTWRKHGGLNGAPASSIEEPAPGYRGRRT